MGTVDTMHGTCIAPGLNCIGQVTELRRAEDVPLRLNLAKRQSGIGHEGAQRNLQETVTECKEQVGAT